MDVFRVQYICKAQECLAPSLPSSDVAGESPDKWKCCLSSRSPKALHLNAACASRTCFRERSCLTAPGILTIDDDAEDMSAVLIGIAPLSDLLYHQ